MEEDGMDTSDHAYIGRALEAERLAYVLTAAAIKGLGPKRTAVLVERFGTLWSLRHASVEEVSSALDRNRPLAQRALQAVA
jgi:excinuclease UvrABC nuclease subunit